MNETTQVQDKKSNLRWGKNTQLSRGRSANFSKPALGNRRMQVVAVNAITAASGANDSDRCESCAQREWQFSIMITKIMTLLFDEVRIFSSKTSDRKVSLCPIKSYKSKQCVATYSNTQCSKNGSYKKRF